MSRRSFVSTRKHFLVLRAILACACLFFFVATGCSSPTTTPPANCGGVCTAEQECVQNQFCLPKCAAGQSRCGVDCVDLQSSGAHCGKCDNKCATGESCQAGACGAGPSCNAPETACGSACADLQTDAANCGACANACKSGEQCKGGKCQPGCATGETDCAGTCVDTSTSNTHCGKCDNACSNAQSCQAGACACPSGQSACGTACVDLQSSSEHCGKCDNKCAAEQTCTSGACACTSGKTNCGGSCVDTDNSDAHCGACDKACPSPQYCDLGKCLCPSGQTVCGGGCVDTNTSNDHCGKCDNKCAAAAPCDQGACTCPDQKTLCTDTCYDTQTDPAHCGQCNNACATGQVCSKGACIKGCPTGETNCSDACVDTNTSSDHCGICDTKCTGGKTCQSGSCACPTGKTDCSGTCADTQTDDKHCGQCGNACQSGQVCRAGTCKAPCPTGETDCSGTCTNTKTDASNCGACGTACTGGKVCDNGTCGCRTGETDCSGSCINTQTDANNCGGCGTKCTIDKVCRDGACQDTWLASFASPAGTTTFIPQSLATNSKGNTYLVANPSVVDTQRVSLRKFDSTGKLTDLSTSVGMPTGGIGFHVSKSHAQNVSATGWVQVGRWRTLGVKGLFDGGGFNTTTGEYTVPVTGYYYFSSQTRLDNAQAGAAGRYVRLQIAINGNKDLNNGLHSIIGNPTAPYFSFNVAGAVRLTKGQKVTLWVYSHTDNSYTIQHNQTSFSGYFIGTTLTSGFHADKSSSQAITATGWNRVQGWRTASFDGAYNSGDFNNSTGEYTAPVDGYYHFYAQVRFDNVDIANANHHIRALFSINGTQPAFDNGASFILGQPKAPYRSLFLSASFRLTKGQKVSLWAYSHSDNSYTIQDETGFGGYLLAKTMPTGFHACKSSAQQVSAIGWTQVAGWKTAGTNGLFNQGGHFDNTTGVYTVPTTGFYHVSSHIRIRNGTEGGTGRYFHIDLAVDGQHTNEGGRWGLKGEPTETWFSIKAESTLRLTKGQKLSVWIYSSEDNNYAIDTESGFSVSLVGGAGTNVMLAKQVATDKDDNVYVSGVSGSYARLGDHVMMGTNGGLSFNSFVAKRDASGSWAWAKAFSPGYESTCLKVDKAGNIFLAGLYGGTWQYSSTRQLTKTPNFLLRLNNTGDIQWGLDFQSDLSTLQLGQLFPTPKCALTGTSTVYLSGNFYGKGTFGGNSLAGSPTTGKHHHYIAYVTDLGLFFWVKELKGEIFTWGVAADEKDNVVVAGSFKGKLSYESDFTYNARAIDAHEGFVVKIARTGAFVWSQKTNTTQGNTHIEQVSVSPKGIIYVSGTFDGAVEFGSIKLSTKGKKDVFVAALNSSGQWLWARQVGNTEDEASTLLTLDALGNFFFFSTFQSATLNVGAKTATKTGTTPNAFVSKNLP